MNERQLLNVQMNVVNIAFPKLTMELNINLQSVAKQLTSLKTC